MYSYEVAERAEISERAAPRPLRALWKPRRDRRRKLPERPSVPVSPEERLNERRLPRLFQKEAVVPVRRLDHVVLDRPAGFAQRRRKVRRTGGRVQPVRAERNEQRAR